MNIAHNIVKPSYTLNLYVPGASGLGPVAILTNKVGKQVVYAFTNRGFSRRVDNEEARYLDGDKFFVPDCFYELIVDSEGDRVLEVDADILTPANVDAITGWSRAVYEVWAQRDAA